MVSVNSEGRAERARTLLSPVLEKFASDPLIERQTLEQAMAARPADSTATRPAGLPPGEERRLIHAHLDAHYRKQLDEPIPALGDISPREAVAGDRQKVVAWLKQLENHAARHDPADPMADYDTRWLWAELGVSDLRK